MVETGVTEGGWQILASMLAVATFLDVAMPGGA